MRAAAIVAVALGVTTLVHGQSVGDDRLTQQLRQLFPGAASFSGRTGSPPHFEAYAPGAERRTVVGLAVWTTDLDPLERGYDGPIKILVGLDLRGTITGVIVADHHEPVRLLLG